MIKTTAMLLKEYSGYADPFGKIHRLTKRKELIPVVRGIYETDKHIPGMYLAPVIYGPSYLSFEYALSFHGMIPERVTWFTSATCQKKRRKSYRNYFGSYCYQDVPIEVFPFGWQLYECEGHSCYVANPAKALCDKLYLINSLKGETMEELLFDDLRIYEDLFEKVKVSEVKFLSKKYNCRNVDLLYEFMEKNYAKYH